MAHDPRNPSHVSNASQKKLQDAIKWSKKQGSSANGKGSARREETADDRDAYAEGWERIFGKKKTDAAE